MVSKYVFLLFFAVTTSSPLEPPLGEFYLAEELITPSVRNTAYRLPEDGVEVELYYIQLTLPDDDFTSMVFDGFIDIFFTNLKDTNEIKLHANKISISDLIVAAQDGTQLQLTNENYESDSVTDILTLTSTTQLPANTRYQIRINYTAELRSEHEMAGFYRSSYINRTGGTVYLGTTQFQSISARKAFPCFDEPGYKAQFDIRIRHPAKYTAVGNTAASRSGVSTDGFVTTTFAVTPRMPTYLIAFVVSDFTCTSGDEIQSGIPHYICSREESSNTRDLAVEYGPKIAWAMEDFTNVKYEIANISKIHQFAIPDFSAGAMENWGLITYRERYLLWDPDHSSNRNLQHVLTIVAHELAHFWFGNLVTCDWWSNTFLNEGFATYFEYHAPNDVDPSLETDKQFVIEEVQPVLVSDASINSAPLSYNASTPAEVSGRFSTISYSKGGSVFRMVRYFMGLENFKQGINKYLIDNQFKNVKPENLWNALQDYVPADLPESLDTVMENWVTRGGYPLLNVTANGRNLSITQERFVSSGTPPTNQWWYIPVTYTRSSDSNKFLDTSTKFWLTLEKDRGIANVLEDADDWIILNNQQIGYYRVDYDKTLREKIKLALRSPDQGGIHELNRAQIVDDFFNFVRYGRHTFAELLDLYRFLEKDTSYYAWYSALTGFSFMYQRTSNANVLRSLTAYLLQLSHAIYNTLPFNEARDDDQIYTLKKALVIPWACRLGLEDCVQNAVAAFSEYSRTSIKPDKNLRSVIYCNGLRHSDNQQSDWNFLWGEYQNTKLSAEQVTILSALGCATNDEILKNYMNMAINDTFGIRRQDSLSVFSAVYAGNPEGVDVAIDYLIENHEAISAYYGSISSIFSGVASRITRKEQTDKLQAFINTTDLGSYQTTAANVVASALNNLVWIEKFEQELSLYFAPTTGSGTSLTVGFVTMLISFLVLFY